MKKVIAILLIIIAAFIVAQRQPQWVEVSHIDSTGMYVNYIDHDGNLYRDVYIEDAPLEVQSIADELR